MVSILRESLHRKSIEFRETSIQVWYAQQKKKLTENQLNALIFGLFSFELFFNLNLRKQINIWSPYIIL